MVQYDKLRKFFQNHNIIFGLLMMAIGLYLSLGGFKNLLPSLYFSGYLIIINRFSLFMVFFVEIL